MSTTQKRRPIFDGFKSGQVARLLGPSGDLAEATAGDRALTRSRDTGERTTTAVQRVDALDGMTREEPIEVVAPVYTQDAVPVTTGDVLRITQSIPGRAPNIDFLTAPHATYWGTPIGPAPGKIGDAQVDEFVRAVLQREPWCPELRDWPFPPRLSLSLVLVQESAIGTNGLQTLRAIAREHDCLVLIETSISPPPVTPRAVPLDWQPANPVEPVAEAVEPVAEAVEPVAEAVEPVAEPPSDAGSPSIGFRDMTAEAVRSARARKRKAA